MGTKVRLLTHIKWTFLVCGLLLALAGGCQSAHSPVATVTGDAPSACDAAAEARRATEAFVPTAMPGYGEWPEPEVTPRVETTGGGGLIPGSPRELLGRSTSAVPTVVVNGADYDIDLPWNNVGTVETAVRFSPGWTGPDSGNAGMAYALYRMSVADFEGEPVFTLYWDSPPADTGDTWLGLANLAENQWDWFSGADPALIDCGSLVPHTANDDQVLVAVVQLGTGQSDLAWVRLGGPLAPEVVLTADPESGSVPLEVVLDASGTTDPDGEVTGFAWDLDDDGVFEVESGLEATRTVDIEELGTYYFAVRATDDEGNQASATVMVSATSPFNQAPAADLEALPPYGVLPLNVTLSAEQSTDPDGEIVSYEWDFDGDGTYDQLTVTDTNSHLYDETGTYNPVVRVTDDESAVDTATVEVQVFAEPSAVLTVDPLTGHAPQGLDFDASASELPGSGIDYYDWDFDGDGEWDATTTVPYAQYGVIDEVVYESRLKIRSTLGPSDTTSLDPPLEVRGWSRSYGGDYADFFNAICADANGNIYGGACTVSYGEGSYDGMVLKVDSDGGLLWARTWGGTGTDYIADIVTDTAGNIFVGGYTWSFAPGGKDDTFVSKLNPDGAVLWTRTWGNDLYDWVNDMAIDSYGCIYAVGETPNAEYGSMEDTLILKYDNNGNLLWAKTFNSGRDDTYPFVSIDAAGNPCITGRSVVAPYGIQANLIRLSPSGELLSQHHWGGDNQEGFYRSQTGPGGATYLTGFSKSFGDSDGDGLLIKLDETGALAWARTWGVDDTGETLTAAHVGNDGLVYACGIHEDAVGAYYGFMVSVTPDGDLVEVRKLATTGITRLWDGFSADGDSFILAGSTVDAYGTWLDFPGVFNTADAAFVEMEGTLTDASGSTSSPVAASHIPSGLVTSDGGGDLDCLAVAFRTPAE